ncbi:MAG: hypothetical protein NTZ39_12035 [Methanoregula sp.]|nr:hypothetical protein [Methanoregula sp.]
MSEMSRLRSKRKHGEAVRSGRRSTTTPTSKDTVISDLLECGLAHELDDGGIPRFGSSDYGCVLHLFYRQHHPDDEIPAAFRHFRFTPAIETIMCL